MARFSDDFLEELKSRVRPSDFIGKTVPLKKAGREYVGLSPFNKEKTPSFYVNDEKGQFFDFSSGKTGDLIDFLIETERLNFVEAVERLAGFAGLSLPAQDPRARAADEKRKGLTDWLETAATWYAAQLLRPVGQEARAYLERRGLPESEWSRFRLGFAPGGRTALKDYLVAKGGNAKALAETGLLIEPEDGGAPYDRFRDRIMFPIRDARGRIVSFGGRAMDPNARAKYLNGPETSVFHKGAHLYGIDGARKLLAGATEPDAPLVVVEGYMDVIACQRAGIAAVAPMGTALGEEQLELLWRYHPEPTLCFDGDRAGRQAAARAIDKALPLLKSGRSVRFAIVEGGKDPDDVLREQGAGALRMQLGRTTPMVEALFVRERDAAPYDTPERKAALRERLRRASEAIKDADLGRAYRADLFKRMDALWAPRPRYGRNAPPPGASEAAKASLARQAGAVPPIIAALAVAAIDDPTVIDQVIERFGAVGFGEPRLGRIASALVELRSAGEDVRGPALRRRLEAEGVTGAMLDQLARDAARAGVAAPFQRAEPEQARTLWERAFDLVARLAAADEALNSVAAALSRPEDAARLVSLKGERDRLRKLIASDWSKA